jgi:hypothetical protein
MQNKSRTKEKTKQQESQHLRCNRKLGGKRERVEDNAGSAAKETRSGG